MNTLLTLRILLFVLSSSLLLVFWVREFDKLVRKYQKYMNAEMVKFWGRGMFSEFSLAMCRLHVGFCAFMTFVVLFAFVFGGVEIEI
jgi:hypothetical protein